MAFSPSNLSDVHGGGDPPGSEWPHSGGSGSGHAFLWDAVNGMQDLGTLPRDSFSRALGINDSGQVVGDSYTAFSAPHAFLWDAVNGIQDLGTLPGGGFSRALGINDNGQVVGSATTADGSYDAFVWQNGTMSDLNDLIPPAPAGRLGSPTRSMMLARS
jgi:probable HAF family extracellular repeat protein